jgi:hypothetical protein
VEEGVKRLSAFFVWLAKELGRAALSPVSKWITAVAGALVLPAIVLWVRRGLSFFATTHAVRGLIVSLAATTILLLLMIVVWQFARIRRLRPIQEMAFSHGGLDWVLAAPFWSNWRTVTLDRMSPEFLRSAVLGPFCGACQVDVVGALRSQDRSLPESCPRCEAKFTVNRLLDVEEHRKLAYLESQAAQRREGTRWLLDQRGE